MDRVSGLDAFLIVGVAALGWELRLLGSVKIRKRTRHHISILELNWVGHRLKQPPPHDFKSLLGAGRPP